MSAGPANKSKESKSRVEKSKLVPDSSVHLDAIRGLAALTVFISHSRMIFLKSGLRNALTGSADEPVLADHRGTIFQDHFRLTSLLSGHQSIGRFAVIIFFVLSGYFVGGSVLRDQRRNQFSWAGYTLQRMTRLWVVLLPALLLTLFLDFGGAHWFASPQNIYHNPASPYGAILDQRLTTSAFFGNLFFMQGIVTPTFGTNEPLWSLSYEFWFYLFFPLLLTAVLPLKRLGVRLASGLLFCALLAFCGWSLAAYFALWGCGVLAALLPLRLSTRAVRFLLPIGILAMAAAMLALLKAHIWRFAGDMLLGIVFTCVLWMTLHLRGATVGRFYRALAQGSSKISYTLYLVHFPLLLFFSAMVYPVWNLRDFSTASLASLFAIDLIVLTAACGMYFCFERNTGRVRNLFGSLAGRPAADPPPALSPVAPR